MSQIDYFIRERLKKETISKLEQLLNIMDDDTCFDLEVSRYVYEEYFQTMKLAKGLFQPVVYSVYWSELWIRSYES